MFNTGPVAIPTFRGRSSPQFGGNISYYADDLLVGKHKFKAGFTQLRELVYFNYADKASGNNQLIYRSGVPFQIATYNRPVTDDKDHQTDTSAYLKDTWSIKRVTANVGVRFQQYHDYTEPAVKVQGTFGNAGSFTGVDVQLKRAVEPRLGVAFDLRGDAKTVLKAFYGRFHLNPGDDFADAYNPNTLVTTTYR